MFKAMFLIEHSKITKQAILWIELGILAFAAAGMQVFLYIATRLEATGSAAEQISQSLTWPGALVNAVGIGGATGIGGLLAIILTGAVTTQEYHWRTLHLWIGHGVPRPLYALSRFASLLLPFLMIVLAALLSGGLASLGISYIVNGSPHLEQLVAGQLVLAVGRAVFTLLPYAALAFLLGIATRSTVAAVGGGLMLSLLAENLLTQLLMIGGGWLAQLTRYLPGSMSGTLMALNLAAVRGAEMSQTSQIHSLPPTAAAAGLALYTLVFLGLAVWRLYRQDLAA